MLNILQVDISGVATEVGYNTSMTDSVTMAIILMLAMVLIGAISQVRLWSVVRKYSHKTTSMVLSGSVVAERMLHDHGIYNVRVRRAHSDQDDHFDHRTLTLTLSDDVYDSCSVLAVATAIYECGHAVQYITGYRPIYMRLRLMPLMRFASRLTGPTILAGILLIALTGSVLLCWVGILLMALATLIAIITQRVEHNATKRAIGWFRQSGEFSAEELSDLHEALRWVARTDFIGAIGALVFFVYSMVRIINRR